PRAGAGAAQRGPPRPGCGTCRWRPGARRRAGAGPRDALGPVGIGAALGGLLLDGGADVQRPQRDGGDEAVLPQAVLDLEVPRRRRWLLRVAHERNRREDPVLHLPHPRGVHRVRGAVLVVAGPGGTRGFPGPVGAHDHDPHRRRPRRVRADPRARTRHAHPRPHRPVARPGPHRTRCGARYSRRARPGAQLVPRLPRRRFGAEQFPRTHRARGPARARHPIVNLMSATSPAPAPTRPRLTPPRPRLLADIGVAALAFIAFGLPSILLAPQPWHVEFFLFGTQSLLSADSPGTIATVIRTTINLAAAIGMP